MRFELYYVTLGMVRDTARCAEIIGRHDGDLAKQLRRAATSVPLNLAEGSYSQNGNRRQCYVTALGSAAEVRACIEVAHAIGYLPNQPELLAVLDRVVATLYRLTHRA